MPEPQWAGRNPTTTSSNGGSTSSGLTHTTITIPHAQILTLQSNGLVLVEPTETLNYTTPPTTLPIPIDCRIIGTSTGATSYGNTDAAQRLILAWALGDVYIGRSVQMLAGNTLQNYFKLPDPNHTMLAATFEIADNPTTHLDTGLSDNGLGLLLINAANADLTGGNTNDKLTVYLTYYWATL